MSFGHLGRAVTLSLISALALGTLPGSASAASWRPEVQGGKAVRAADHVPGEVIVRYRDGVGSSAQAASANRAGGQSADGLGRAYRGLARVKLRPGVSVDTAIDTLKEDPAVLYAEPNYVVSAQKQPDDPRFSQQWALHNTEQSGGLADADIDAPDAWDATTGSQSTVIAVLDTGIDYRHPDLAPNIWVNSEEVAGNGVDDDKNGYVDDVYGIDTINGDSDPLDDSGHGTQCAGIIGAKGGNSVGVTGVAWAPRLMAVKMLDDSGTGTTSSILAAIEYARTMGAQVVNCSWTLSSNSQAVAEAVANSGGSLFVFAAGNSNTSSAYYPAALNLPHTMSVGASTHNDVRASYSNFGSVVDLFAPGHQILSTSLPGRKLGDQPAFAEDFSHLDRWTVGSYGGASNPWALSTAQSVSPPSSVAISGYADMQEESIELKADAGFSLGSGSEWALTGRVSHNLDPDNDALVAFIRSDQQPDWELIQWWDGNSGGFAPFEVDISEFAGHTGVRLSFDLWSFEPPRAGSGTPAVYLDDIRVLPFVPDYSSAYAVDDGTSFAAPHVAGTAALMLAKRPGLAPGQLKQAIKDSVDRVGGVGDLNSRTHGRLNAKGAVDHVAASVGGYVRYPGGAPMSGAEVSVGSYPVAKTRDDGSYALFDIPSGQHTVRISKPGWGTVLKKGVLVPQAGRASVHATLQPAARIVGRVSYRGAIPLGGFKVVTESGPPVYTGADGRFVINDLDGGVHLLTATKPGYVATEDYAVYVYPGSTTNQEFYSQPTNLKPTIKRSPNKSTLTYKRKGRPAAVKIKLSAQFTEYAGHPLANQWVYLQARGKTRKGKIYWSNTYKLRTDNKGRVSKTLRLEHKGTRYYRWAYDTNGWDGLQSSYAKTQKIVVK